MFAWEDRQPVSFVSLKEGPHASNRLNISNCDFSSLRHSHGSIELSSDRNSGTASSEGWEVPPLGADSVLQHRLFQPICNGCKCSSAGCDFSDGIE